MAALLLLNGPNLNLLGQREPEIYGHSSLAEIEAQATEQAMQRGHSLATLHSNHEGELLDRIAVALADGTDFILINAGALTHTSIALRDALAAVNKPFIELHMSNLSRRETFRQQSYLADLAVGVISGFGAYSYTLAIAAADNYLNNQSD